ncbi:MAG: Rha family transcriptional regulator [Oscillospiraceae bacterium]|nr:Rha family transcriptional regulator [Oscillospiraceae bacterium]
MENELVFLPDNYINAEPYTTSLIVADCAEIKHHTIQVLISKYENDLSELGTLSFEMRACPHKTGAALEKIYHLNEQQATLLITYMKNTEPVRKFKKALVKGFFAMKEELTERRINRSMLKHTHKSLAEAVKLIPPHPHSAFDYAKYHALAYIVAFGCSPSKLKKRRNAKTEASVADYLTAAEIESVANIKDKICVCLEMDMEYAEIKDKLMKMQIQNLSSKED